MEKRRKELIGIVTSAKNDKTITVTIETYKKSPLYGKRVKSSKKYTAHDLKNEAKGDGFIFFSFLNRSIGDFK